MNVGDKVYGKDYCFPPGHKRMKKIDWFSVLIYGYVLINVVAVIYFIVVLITLACQALAR